ncbi:MAG: CRISPR-associated protein Csx15 [Anaerolineales bacterium]
MLLLNYSHPLTPAQRGEIESITGQALERVVDIASQIDAQQPLGPQVAQLAEAAGLTAQEWQTAQILVNPPALNYSAALLLAELHGRMGYFAPCLRLRPVPGSLPPRFEVAEIINLQAVRDAARRKR